MKRFLLLISILLVGCSSNKVVFDYDNSINFNNYKTFDFFEDAGEGLSELDVKRIKSELTEQLLVKGISQKENPDFYINFLANTKEETSRNSIGIGLGSGGSNVGFGVSGGIPIERNKLVQELTVNFVKNENNDLIWQSIAKGVLKEQTTPEERDDYYKKIITEVIKGYPPKK